MFLALLFFGLTAHASNSVLGVPEGSYRGSGILHSDSVLVPDLDFVSSRKIVGDVIIAKTTARFVGHDLATAAAKLKANYEVQFHVKRSAVSEVHPHE